MASQFDSVEALLEKANDLFLARFGKQPTVAVFAPGRVNLIGLSHAVNLTPTAVLKNCILFFRLGDHVDYCGGFVLPMVG